MKFTTLTASLNKPPHARSSAQSFCPEATGPLCLAFMLCNLDTSRRFELQYFLLLQEHKLVHARSGYRLLLALFMEAASPFYQSARHSRLQLSLRELPVIIRGLNSGTSGQTASQLHGGREHAQCWPIL